MPFAAFNAASVKNKVQYQWHLMYTFMDVVVVKLPCTENNVFIQRFEFAPFSTITTTYQPLLHDMVSKLEWSNSWIKSVCEKSHTFNKTIQPSNFHSLVKYPKIFSCTFVYDMPSTVLILYFTVMVNTMYYYTFKLIVLVISMLLSLPIGNGQYGPVVLITILCDLLELCCVIMTVTDMFAKHIIQIPGCRKNRICSIKISYSQKVGPKVHT